MDGRYVEHGSMQYYNKLLDEVLLDLHDWTDYKFNILSKEFDIKMEVKQQIRYIKEYGFIIYNSGIDPIS